MDQTIALSVGEVCAEIVRAAGGTIATVQKREGALLCGRLLHEVLADLLGSDERLSWRAAVQPDDTDAEMQLVNHTYRQLLGPRLVANRGSLEGMSGSILALWQSLKDFNKLLSALLDAAQKRGLLAFDAKTAQWRQDLPLCSTEESITWELSESHRPSRVRIHGIADAIWMNPETRQWYVLEFKTGSSRPEADLAQACLYHQMIAATRPDYPAASGIVLLRFTPELQVLSFTNEQIAEVQQRLRALIGRMASVADGKQQAKIAPLIPEEFNEDHDKLGRKVLTELDYLGCKVSLSGGPIVGPAYLRFILMPERGIKVHSIKRSAQDLQIRLGLEHTPVIHNQGGQLAVDVQRPDPQIVSFSGIRDRLPKADALRGSSKLVLGMALNGELVFADLASHDSPHLLVAGTSGSGKSEWLRSAVASLIVTNEPSTLSLVLIDPKRTAFGELKGSAYLYDHQSLVYPPEQSASEVLDRLVKEMEDRYRLLDQHRCDTVAELATVAGHPMPRIVCVCDEFADLILADKNERRRVEERVVRLGSKARAAGIHLILATQYPNRDVVTGPLKGNLSSRVCFRTTNHTQSHLMGTPGAEHLLGRGDMLFRGVGNPIRLQSPFLQAETRRAIFRQHAIN